ncbi:MAG: RNA polymerase sporulation sigma factor SigK [bacterium]
MIFLLNLIKGFFFFSGSYSNEIFPEPLSEDEEKKCILEMKNGSKDARNKLIEHNLRLVAHIVKKFDSKNADVDDLISIGTIGLIKGIDTYKFDQDVKITTYAARCIQNEILMNFRSNKKTNLNISLDDYVGFDKDGNEIRLIDVLKDESTDFIEQINTKDNIKRIEDYLCLLNTREKDIIIKRYGLYNTKAQTQKDIAKNMKISRSYVSRIEKRALTKMLRLFYKSKNDI